jgi:hypothetical protein
MRTIAKTCGYCLAVHGSQQRDFDLVAVHWVDDAVKPEMLAEMLRRSVRGFFGPDSPFQKPHGRKVWTIVVPSIEWSGGNGFIDLGVITGNPLIADNMGER